MYPLVDTAWLAEHLHDEDLRVVDIRGHVLPASEPPPHYFAHRADYDAAHIPGAVFVDWTRDIVEPGSPSQDVLAPQAFAEVMQNLGLGDEHRVVAYDDANGMFAARLWWALNLYGHERVAVLDGGWQKWSSEGRVISTQPATPPAATFTPRLRPQWRKEAEAIAAHLDDSALQLMDVRSPLEYAGQASRARRKGHLPGAINVPRKSLLAPDGTLLPPQTLRERFAAAGLHLNGSEIVVYCNAGVSASYGLLALHVAGHERAAVYDGSWKDWGNHPERPIVAG